MDKNFRLYLMFNNIIVGLVARSRLSIQLFIIAKTQRSHVLQLFLVNTKESNTTVSPAYGWKGNKYILIDLLAQTS